MAAKAPSVWCCYHLLSSAVVLQGRWLLVDLCWWLLPFQKNKAIGETLYNHEHPIKPDGSSIMTSLVLTVF